MLLQACGYVGRRVRGSNGYLDDDLHAQSLDTLSKVNAGAFQCLGGVPRDIVARLPTGQES